VDLDHDTFSKHQFSRGPDALPHLLAEPGKPALAKLMVVRPPQPSRTSQLPTDHDPSTDPTRDDRSVHLEEQNLNRNAFSAALGCYPYATLVNQATLCLVRYCGAD
jgi:hypothetical protein